VNVYVAEEEIDEKMWILERTFTQDRSGGQRTKVKVLVNGALALGELPKG
jgi:hypothetical protein